MKFHSEHIFTGVTLDEFEKLYFDEEFNVALCEAVNLARTLVKLEDDGTTFVREVNVGPDRVLPRPVAKVAGTDRIEYMEHVDYRWGSHQVEWYTEPSILKSKVQSHGVVYLEERPEGVARRVEGEVAVKVFGLGGIVEAIIVADVEKSYADAARFTQQWIDKKQAS